MLVNFEFLGNEPIENIITSMHFKIDKVVFFGYHDCIQRQKKSTEEFLVKECGVQKVVFQPLSNKNLPTVLKTMREAIEYEISQGNNIYYDVTGGEGIILVAFGMLAKEFNTPMHLYNVYQDNLVELDEGAIGSISKEVPQQSIKLNLDNLIKLRGGIVNYNLQKNIKDDNNKKFMIDASKIWDISKEYKASWNVFSSILRRNFVPNDNLIAHSNLKELKTSISIMNTKQLSVDTFQNIINALKNAGILIELKESSGMISFRYKSRHIMESLFDGGSVLELFTYNEYSNESDDCMVGVHIDWDGVINGQGEDVLNEIDVLSLKDNIPTFISCKSGKLPALQVLHALYELETVATRFGGKYAKKVLVVMQELSDNYIARAKEMNIDVVLAY